jgi:hypothetical protein
MPMLSESDLAAIAARAEKAIEYTTPVGIQRVLEEDVPALLAEVERLRSEAAGLRKAQVKRSGIYVASKTRHAAAWRQHRSDGLPIVATWIDEAGPGESESMSDLWLRCIREPSGAAAVVMYAEPEDELKGAFIEVGAALASGVPVYVVGRRSNWSWTNHPLVTVCATVAEAFVLAMRHHDRPR